MKTLATNEFNDIFIDKGNLALVEDDKAIANIAKNRVCTLQGEHQYDLSEGIPYFNVLFGFRPNVDLFKFFLQREMLNVENVHAIKSLETSVEGDKLTYTAELQTKEGVVTI